MILSMTGYGSARHSQNGLCHELEIRSVNNRFLKLSIKLPERLQFAEGEIDKLLRDRLGRGSVTLSVRCRGEGDVGAPLDVRMLQQYVDAFSGVRLPEGIQPVVDLAGVAALPGVSDPPELDDDERRSELALLVSLAGRGVEDLIAMRREEGRTLQVDLLSHCDAVRERLKGITGRAPGVVDEYRERLRSRVAILMQAGGFELAADALAREVALFAERCDISEEIHRLRSHLDQFVELCDRGDQVGRTLDFLVQEMLREANTIGSKSNDAAITREVVEIKGLIDRLKEQVQNVE